MTKSIFTLALHAGSPPAPDFIPVVPPIYTAVTYTYPFMKDMEAVFSGEKSGYVYARHGAPTTASLEKAVAALEGGDAALAFSSGMAAIHAALLATGIKKEDCILAANDLYGATRTLLAQHYQNMGIKTYFVDIFNLQQVEDTLETAAPKVLFFESISNPLLRVANIPELTALAHQYNTRVIVDSTFATPYLITPLQHGADLVVHSSTKYISGHGDALGGVVTYHREFQEPLYDISKMLGATLGPFEAYLTLRGLKTLPLRMKRHCENALAVAECLKKNPRIRAVHYPGLSTHPHHDLASRLYEEKGYGGVVTFEIKNAGQKEVFAFFEALTLITPATSLGDIYSLILYPVHASHRGLTSEERKSVGITEGMVRLSVGIEDSRDIIADIEQGLQSL
ncbi:MAG: PLP-dependent transferase [Theionarchaea archaeon]|nr:PLP-dependent transferase [Theionarchaea archaeon]MBU6999696.1 PLP-dependent transferase [Theionarchaea archaeon]MBU7020672.1 PLP-dependent transferase [Theionarchaea archaeon]MBU7039846.1 PLP-dependent transferase [Theionarchaea archaeon]